MSVNKASSWKLWIDSQVPFSLDVEKAGDDINAYMNLVLNPNNKINPELLKEEEAVISEMSEEWDSSVDEKTMLDIIWKINLELWTEKEWLAWTKQDDELLKKWISLLEQGNSIEDVTKYIEIIKIGQ